MPLFLHKFNYFHTGLLCFRELATIDTDRFNFGVAVGSNRDETVRNKECDAVCGLDGSSLTLTSVAVESLRDMVHKDGAFVDSDDVDEVGDSDGDAIGDSIGDALEAGEVINSVTSHSLSRTDVKNSWSSSDDDGFVFE